MLRTLLLATLMTTSCAHSQISPDRLRQIAPSVRTVSVGLGHGTGFAISKSLVMTADHVCDGYDEGKALSIKTKGKTIYLVPVYRSTMYQGDDVCVLEGSHGLEPLDIAPRPARLGDHVTVYGSPGWARDLATDGRMGPFVNVNGWGSRRLLSAGSTGGNSGGPVLDNRGRVVGVLVGGNPAYDHSSLMATHAAVMRALEAVNHGR